MTERFLDEVFNDFMAVRQEWSDQGADNKYTSSSRGQAQGWRGLVPEAAMVQILAGTRDPASRQDSCGPRAAGQWGEGRVRGPPGWSAARTRPAPAPATTHSEIVKLGWAGLGWAGLGWAGLGWPCHVAGCSQAPGRCGATSRLGCAVRGAGRGWLEAAPVHCCPPRDQHQLASV